MPSFSFCASGQSSAEAPRRVNCDVCLAACYVKYLDTLFSHGAELNEAESFNCEESDQNFGLIDLMSGRILPKGVGSAFFLSSNGISNGAFASVWTKNTYGTRPAAQRIVSRLSVVM
jgi:hypothetical protein